jgi:cytochrome P450
MEVEASVTRPHRARRLPTIPTALGLLRDPLGTVERLGAEAAGDPVRIDLGLFRPYLLTHPDHVGRVLRDNCDNYPREGMMWRPLRRLFGDGLGGEGAEWASSRRLIQPLFSARDLTERLDGMAATITAGVDALIREAGPGADTGTGAGAGGGRAVDAEAAMTRIVHDTLVRLFFGGRIGADDAQRLGRAVTTAFTSVTWRMLAPFVPESVPMPGDRAFRRAVAVADDVLLPLVRQCRDGPPGDDRRDLVTVLCHATDADGRAVSDRRVRDDVMAMFGGGTETTALMLTWLWVVLDAHPHVAATLRAEVDAVVGAGPVTAAHLGELRYLRMVLQELLRLYPVGWIIPRAVRDDDVVGGVRIPGGSTVILSPYLTQRMPRVWPDPLTFDPSRFDPERAARQHRFAHFPFSGGPHQCLGGHLFLVEASLIAAATLSRCRPRLVGAPPRPKAAVSLRPDRRVWMVLEPRIARS